MCLQRPMPIAATHDGAVGTNADGAYAVDGARQRQARPSGPLVQQLDAAVRRRTCSAEQWITWVERLGCRVWGHPIVIETTVLVGLWLPTDTQYFPKASVRCARQIQTNCDCVLVVALSAAPGRPRPDRSPDRGCEGSAWAGRLRPATPSRSGMDSTAPTAPTEWRVPTSAR